MSFRNVITLLACLFILAGSTFANEGASEKSENPLAAGDALLKKGDFTGAYKSYTAAAKADPENRELAAKAMLVRRVMTLRKFVAEGQVSPQWEKMVVSLHAFYLSNGILEEALALDRVAHDKINNAMSASLLAETLLEMNRNEEALAHLRSLDRKLMDDQNTLYFGITLARLGKRDEAKKVAGKCPSPSCEADPLILYDSARLKALMGEEEEAGRMLVRCFEAIPPSQLDMVKGFAMACPDFKSLKASGRMAAVLKTESKIEESSCSGGTSCGSCPNSQGCSSEKKTSEDCGSGSSGDEGSSKSEKKKTSG